MLQDGENGSRPAAWFRAHLGPHSPWGLAHARVHLDQGLCSVRPSLPASPSRASHWSLSWTGDTELGERLGRKGRGVVWERNSGLWALPDVLEGCAQAPGGPTPLDPWPPHSAKSRWP